MDIGKQVTISAMELVEFEFGLYHFLIFANLDKVN